MKRVTSLLTLLLTWICVSMQAQVTPLTNVPDGDYYIVCPAASNHFAYYDGINAFLRRSSSAPTAANETGIFTLTQGTDANAGKYTIQCGGKYVVAGTSLQHSAAAGVNVKLVDEAEATNINKWWILAQDASNANLIDIFPYQANIAAKTPAWNFASDHGGNANQAVGVYDASDGNSQWALLSTTGGVISLNFGSGNGNANTAEGIVNVHSTAWNNLSAKENTRTDLKTWNGQTGAAETLPTNWNVSWTAGATWYHTTNISENILKGYLDDNDTNQATVTFTNLPFTTGYDVYIYKAADSNSKFSTVSVTIGEQTYTYTTDETGTAYFGDAQWGQSQQATSALGTNVICIKGLTASSITIKGGKRSAGRGAIAAIQVVETGVSKVINVTEDVFDARHLTAPVYLKKTGNLTIKVASEASKAKYVDASGVTGTVTYEYDEQMQIAEKKAILTATLDPIAEHVGTNPGQLTTNDAYAAARALLENPNSTLAALEAETAKAATEYYTVNMPEQGVDYVLRNVHYTSSILTSNGNNAVGQATPGIVNFEPVEDTTDQFYIKVNGLYVGVCYMSQPVTLSDSKANARPYSFGINNWNVVMQDMQQTSDTGYAYLHLAGDGNIVGWEKAGGATQWTFLSTDDALNVVKNQLQSLVNSVEVNFGTNPGQYNNSDNGAALDAAKTVLADENATLQQLRDNYLACAPYTLIPFTPGYYRFRNAVKDGYMYSDGTNLKWKALDANDATMVWHVSAVSGSNLTLSNYGDGKIPQSSDFNTNITMADDANTNIDYLTYGSSQVKIRMNGAQGAYANDNGTVKNYNTSVNGLDAWYVERIDFLDAFEGLGFTAADKFNLLEGATVNYPNEFGWSQYNLTPEGINTAIDNMPAANSTLSEKEAFMATENGQTLKRYRKMLTDHPDWAPTVVSFEMKAEYGTLILPFSVVRPDGLEVFTCAGVEANGTTLTLTPIPGDLVHNTPYIIKGAVGAKYSLVGFDKGSRMTHTAGYLTGVLNEGGVNVPGGSYVLSKYQGVLAFYMVENGVSKNCPQFKCYFTAPAGSANAKAFFFNPGDVTGIDAIVTDGGKAEIYNVHGQRLNGLRKGLNIVNGRKVVVK